MRCMTAKKKLRQAIEQLSEAEAHETLRHLAQRHSRDPLIEFLDAAPEEEEHITPEDEKGLREARAQAERAETIPLEELLASSA